MAAAKPSKEARDTRSKVQDAEVESEDLFGFDRLGDPPPEESGSSALAAVADGIDLEELVAALPDLGKSKAEREAPALAARIQEEEEELEEELEDEQDAAAGEPVPAGPIRFSPAMLVLLVVVTLMNVGAVGLTWRTSRKLERTVSEVGKEVIHTAEDLRDQTAERTREIEQLVQPVVAPNSAQEQTLQWAQEDLERGDFAMARRRLNGLLAVIDSFDAKVRGDVEARAAFLLADSLLLEASARREELP